MKEFNAVKSLYEELVEKYKKLNVEDKFFEYNHIYSWCFVNRKLSNQEQHNINSSTNHDLISMDVDMCLDKLVKMEKDFNELKRFTSQN